MKRLAECVIVLQRRRGLGQQHARLGGNPALDAPQSDYLPESWRSCLFRWSRSVSVTEWYPVFSEARLGVSQWMASPRRWTPRALRL